MNPSIQTQAATPRGPNPRSSSDALSAASGAAAPGDFSAALRAILPAPTPDTTLPREASPPRHDGRSEGTEDRGHGVPEGPTAPQAGRPRRIPAASTTPPGGPGTQAPEPDAPALTSPAPMPMPEALLPPDAASPPPEAPMAPAPDLPSGVLLQPEAPMSPIAPLEAEPPADAPPVADRQAPWAWLPPQALPADRAPWPQPAPPDVVVTAALPAGVLADARAAAALVAKPVLEPGIRTSGPTPTPTPVASAAVAGDEARDDDPPVAAGAWGFPSGTFAISEAMPQRSALPIERPLPEAPRAELMLAQASARAEWLQAAPPAPQGQTSSLGLPASPPLAVNQPAFADELGTQVAMWTRQGVQQAELRLNPAEMGPVQVRIQLQGDQAQVQFVAEAAATRDALQAALPELSQALAAEGLQLAGADVQAGHQEARKSRTSGDGEAHHAGASGRGSGFDGEETEGSSGVRPPSARSSRGLLDLYA
ncbi:MAG: flagellar hook-length control protein FliK [Burkholderiales bacterium]|nr:flagellar hook-length control protein FliK [Burkholderiales bacterium]